MENDNDLIKERRISPCLVIVDSVQGLRPLQNAISCLRLGERSDLGQISADFEIERFSNVSVFSYLVNL